MDCGSFVVRSGSEEFEKEMSVTQKEGITISLPKGNKPREYVKDWRPISLSNVTYNITAASITNRVKTILLNRVDEDKTGCVKGRYISDNVTLLYSIIYYFMTKNQPDLLVSVDFEKAFDSISSSYIQRVFKCNGFRKDICRCCQFVVGLCGKFDLFVYLIDFCCCCCLFICLL